MGRGGDGSKAYEGPERRGDPRLRVADGVLTIDGRAFRLTNWSAAGFVAEGDVGGLATGTRMVALFALTIPAGRIEASATLELTRVEAGRIAGTWTISGVAEDIYPQVREFLYTGTLVD
ncbi:MAG: hypothetical protein OHK0024_35750 [Thalassobaculales bacterium]